jgi:MerR family transcriptional regulator, repressor of the yfmOP operon
MTKFNQKRITLDEIRNTLIRIEAKLKANPPFGTEWVEPETICRVLGVSRRTLRNYTSKGYLPFSRIGARIFYRLSDIDDFLSSQLIRKTPHA